MGLEIKLTPKGEVYRPEGVDVIKPNHAQSTPVANNPPLPPPKNHGQVPTDRCIYEDFVDARHPHPVVASTRRIRILQEFEQQIRQTEQNRAVLYQLWRHAHDYESGSDSDYEPELPGPTAH